MSKVLAYSSINNLCDLIDCEHKTTPYIDESDYLVVRTSNIRNGRLVFEDMKYTTKEAFSEWTQRAIPSFGDVLFTREAPAGEACLVPEELNVCMGQRMVLLRPKLEMVNPIFLSQYLSTERCKSDIKKLTIGSTVPRINISEIRELMVYVPPLPEQTKIAQILSTWDKAIAITEQLLGNSQQQKKALMQGLLTGKKRLPGFKGELRLYSFSDVSRIDKDNLNNKTLGSFSFKYISLSDVKVGVIAEKLECFTFENAPSRARRIIKEGDILLATVRPNLQGFARIEKQHEDMIASTGFSVLSPKELFCSDYIYHYLFSDSLTSQIDSLVVGSNYPAINSSDVANLQILCPDYNEQIKIAEVLDNCANVIETLQKKLAFLKQEKTALMQQLLTGKRRVKVEAA